MGRVRSGYEAEVRLLVRRGGKGAAGGMGRRRRRGLLGQARTRGWTYMPALLVRRGGRARVRLRCLASGLVVRSAGKCQRPPCVMNGASMSPEVGHVASADKGIVSIRG